MSTIRIILLLLYRLSQDLLRLLYFAVVASRFELCLEPFAGIRDPFSERGEDGFCFLEAAFLLVGVSVDRSFEL